MGRAGAEWPSTCLACARSFSYFTGTKRSAQLAQGTSVSTSHTHTNHEPSVCLLHTNRTPSHTEGTPLVSELLPWILNSAEMELPVCTAVCRAPHPTFACSDGMQPFLPLRCCIVCHCVSAANLSIPRWVGSPLGTCVCLSSVGGFENLDDKHVECVLTCGRC